MADRSRQQAGIKAGRIPGVTSRSFLVNGDQQRVTVAIQADLAHPLAMPAGLTFDPVLLSASGKIGGSSGGQRAMQRFVIHPANHQYRPGVPLLHDGRHQAGGIALQPGGDRWVETSLARGAHTDILPCSADTPETISSRTWTHRPSKMADVTFAAVERRAICDLLLEKGPAEPTLCDGWLTQDLAVHLWLREHRLLASAGAALPPLAGELEKRTTQAKQVPYADLVEQIRRGPARLSPWSLPGVDKHFGAFEYFIHHEDVRRAGPDPMPPREFDDATQQFIWNQLKQFAKFACRRVKVGLVLERVGGGTRFEPDLTRGAVGTPIVTVIGLPSELMLFVTGRGRAAEVHLVGEQAGLDALAESDLGI